VNHYENQTGEPFVSQVDSPNRKRDRDLVERLWGFKEQGNRYTTYCNERSLILGNGYLRVLYGDHGPYLEVLARYLNRSAWGPRQHRGASAYYDECFDVDGTGVKLYIQRRDVSGLPNPPQGDRSCNNNRPEGYADYRVGRGYISVLQLHKPRAIHSERPPGYD
jgi:hypothetical protein